uniref:ADAM metallopeptidase with thrombospondin type 1 motif 17 n=1 Tax=Anolis carolinensis TaxID=28377 RepID=A0A803T0E9_ANOCA
MLLFLTKPRNEDIWRVIFTISFSPSLSPFTASDDVEVVIPEWVPQERIHFLQAERSQVWGGRSRRSASFDPEEEDAEAALFIRLPAGSGLHLDSDLYLSLRPNAQFLAPGFSVQEIPEDPSVERNAGVDRSCFYTGHVLNRSVDSFASLSTCNGLVITLFDGKEHFLRRKRSARSTRPARPGVPGEHCKVVAEKKRQKKAKLTDDWRERRNAIRLMNEYTVETLVVADSDMVQYHGADAAQRFILTVMNMVYNMFQHQSLGVKVNIRVTKLVLLRRRPAKLSIGHHGERSLESFCHWQNEEFGGANVDMVLSLTVILTYFSRTDFCVHKDEPCDTVGIAYLGGICSAKRKCVLAEDNGLNLAFTIAHELGHNMGMSHDDDHLSCAGRSHIMSGEWVKGRNPSDLSWSSCSRDDLEKFLKSKVSTCLLVTDPRSRYAVRLPYKLPGMHYSADEQCQILFGTNATFCKNMEPFPILLAHLMCAGLWCLVEGDASCKTKLDPPLDGTECGADKWCRTGECVSKTPIPEHVDGDWNMWSQWSMCSRTCGTGARFRQRKCDNPPPGPGGKNCRGASVEHTVCENVPCPKGAPTFRDQQCQKARLLVNPCSLYRKLKKAFKQGLHPIELKISISRFRILRRPSAQFSAQMGKNNSCLLEVGVNVGETSGENKIGCDGIIGSAAREDRCGICNGDGKTCKVVKGDFNHTKGMGYIEAAVIPAGARRIRVMEDKPAHSFLALKDSSKKSINSDWKIELPGEFQIAGTTVRYVRRGLWEKISAKGPTKIPLHLMVLLFHDQNYGIHYEYTIPVNYSAENRSEPEHQQESLYIWTHSGWEGCSVQCGGGERKTIVSCTQIVNKTMMLVNDSACQRVTRPEPQVRRCNVHPCQSRWVAGQWSPCSATCAKGTQRREVTCVYQLQNGSYVNTRDLYCLGPKPTAVQSCEGRDCVSIWEASEWSKCSSSCGRGKQKRTVTCTNSQGKCDAATRPRDEEECEDHTGCYEWKTGDWSKCSSTCGKGLQSRVVQCMHKVTGRHGNECPTLSKPAAYRQCHQEACNEKINVNTITSPRLAALTYKCAGDQWTVYCRVIREKNLCQDMRWYQRCCQTCRDFYASKMQQKS